jgi:cation/acetate symporter
MTFVLAAGVQALPLAIFAAVLAVTMAITWWASKRTSTTTEFFTAGRGISGLQNGWAIAGDYMSASSFLGFAGLVFLFGVDAFVSLMAALVAFLPVLLFLAERMRNSGKYTLADVLAFRMRERPARTAAALGTLAVLLVYLVAQMVGAGVLIQALIGISFIPAVVIVGAFMLAYVIFGGMLATTWVQIVKAVVLMSAGVLLTVMVLAKFGFDPGRLFTRAAAQHEAKDGYLHPGLQFDTKLGMLSFGIAFVLGTAGLPHILIRFFTVPDARAARSSVGWAVFLIGAFYLMVMVVGVGARAILGQAGEAAAGKGGNLAIPTLAESLGGGAGSTGGQIFLAVISAVALATILAVVAGLVISASGAVAHDLWSNVVRRGRKTSEREELWVAKVAAAAIGALAILLAIAGGAGFNVSALVGLAFCIAASANFPALVLALFWPRFNTAGAVTGVLTGVVVSATLIVLSPPVWPGADTVTGSPLGSLGLENPAIFCIPLGFLGCVIGTLLGRERDTERTYHELYVRAETGLGAEEVTSAEVMRPRARRRTETPAAAR